MNHIYTPSPPPPPPTTSTTSTTSTTATTARRRPPQIRDSPTVVILIVIGVSVTILVCFVKMLRHGRPIVTVVPSVRCQPHDSYYRPKDDPRLSLVRATRRRWRTATLSTCYLTIAVVMVGMAEKGTHGSARLILSSRLTDIPCRRLMNSCMNSL